MIYVQGDGYHYRGLYWDLKYKEIYNFYTLHFALCLPL